MTQSFTPLSDRLITAINVATTAHDGHFRKGTSIPYVSHLFGVMHLVATETSDEDIVIAALFHDILEDVPDQYSAEEMATEFGLNVVKLVRGVTKNSELGSWQERADAYLSHLEEAPEGSVLISGADKFHNLSSILMDIDAHGDDLWNRFNSGKERQQWWYSSVYDLVSRRLPDVSFLPAYKQKLDRLNSL